MKAELDPCFHLTHIQLPVLETYIEATIPICPAPHIFIHTVKISYFANYVSLSLVTLASFMSH